MFSIGNVETSSGQHILAPNGQHTQASSGQHTQASSGHHTQASSKQQTQASRGYHTQAGIRKRRASLLQQLSLTLYAQGDEGGVSSVSTFSKD